MKYKHDKIKIIILKYVIFLLYFGLNLFILGSNMFLPTLLMSLALLITLFEIYYSNLPFFSAQNIFCIFFLWAGCFFRYLWVGIIESNFLKIAYIPINNTLEYHIKTSSMILLVVISLSIGIRVGNKIFNNKIHINNKKKANFKLSYGVLLLLYYILLFIVFGYKINNLRLSTELNFGTFDNVITTLSYIVKFIAYYHLAKYLKSRKLREILVYLLYVLPIIIISLISAWKGTLVFEIIAFCIIYNVIYKKIKIKYIACIMLALILIIPLISIRRDNLKYNLNIPINISNMQIYLKDNNIITYLSYRFCYYDELYYVLNVGEPTINTFIGNVGGMTNRLIFAFIPRVLYPSKGIVNTGVQVTHYIYRYPTKIYNNLGITYVGDLWVYYGILGVIIGNGIIGIFIRKLEKSNQNTSSDLAKYSIITVFLISFGEGDLVSSLVQLVLILFVLFIVKRFFVLDSNDYLKNNMKR